MASLTLTLTLTLTQERTLLESVVAPAVDHLHARIGTPQVDLPGSPTTSPNPNPNPNPNRR